MQSKPLISILTPCRNAKKTLEETAQGVLNQTYPYWEWLLVDDGSQDGTIELIKSLSAKDPRIKLVQNPMGGSPGKSRQLGFEKSQGEWCAFLDADDLWLPEKLEKQVPFAAENNYLFTFHGYRRISVDGSKTGCYLGSAPTIGLPELLSSRPIGNLTVMVHRKLLEGVDFPSTFNEDFRLWLIILKKGIIAHFLDQDLARYRIVPGSRGANKKWVALDILKAYLNDSDLALHKRLWYFSKYAVNSLRKYSQF